MDNRDDLDSVTAADKTDIAESLPENGTKKKKGRNKPSKKNTRRSSPSSSFDRSLVKKFLRYLGGVDGYAGDSLILSGLRKVGFLKKVKKFKFKVAAEKDTGIVSHCFNSLLSSLFSASLGIYATLFLIFGFFGVFVTLTSALLNYGSFFRADITDFITEIIIIILSLILYSGGKKSLGEAILSSKLVSKIAFGTLGIREESLEKYQLKQESFLVPVLIGFLGGLLTIAVSPLDILRTVFITAVCAVVLCTPESGIVITFLALPFIGASGLTVITVYTLVCFMLKVMIGKRSFKPRVIDWCVFVFAVFNLLGGFAQASSNGSGDSTVRMWFILSFVLVSLMIKTRAWVTRCIKAIGFSVSLLSVGCIVTFIIGHLEAYSDNYYLNEALAMLPDNFGDGYNTGMMILFTFPFLVASVKNRASNRRSVFGWITVAGALTAVIFTGNIPLWLGLFAGIAFYILNKSKKNIYGIAAFLLTVSLVIIFIPESYRTIITEFTGITENSISDVFMNTASVIAVAVENLLVGVGISPEALSMLRMQKLPTDIGIIENCGGLFFVTSAKTGIFSLIILILIFAAVTGMFIIWGRSSKADAKMSRVAGAGFLMLFAACITGCIYYIFTETAHLLLFWMLLGLMYSSCNVIKDEAGGVEDENIVALDYQTVLKMNSIPEKTVKKKRGGNSNEQ